MLSKRFLFLLLAIPLGARGGPALETFRNLPLRFEENRGQTSRDVKFLARGRGYALFLTQQEAVLHLGKAPGDAVVRMKLAGADRRAQPAALEPLPGRSNYFLGGESQWLAGVPNYGKILYKSIYPGIDLVFYGKEGQLEYDLVLAPGADPSQIRLDFDGITGLRISPEGDLLLATAAGEIRQRRPVIYERAGGATRPVAGGYVVRGGRSAAFRIAAYDRERPLVIDPVLQYSTFLGGNADDSAAGVGVDLSGNVYVVGTTLSRNFPVASPAQPASGGGKDVFVAKLNASGSAIGYATYLGGSGDDFGAAIALDAAGNAYITGNTLSSNFPTTAGALQSTFGGTASATLGDAFVAKLDPNGLLVYSTYLGGSGDDAAYGIAIDSSGSAYVTGSTASTNFPVTASAFRIFLGGSNDAFISKLSPNGASLSYSTFLGGTETEKGLAIAVDSSGNAYVTGSTSSSNFPIVGGVQPDCAPSQTPFTTACADAFVTKLNPQGSLLVYSTFLGGRGTDSGRAIAVGPGGSAYVAGVTDSGNFPITPGVVQAVFASGSLGDGFVARLNSSGSALAFSTFLGGSGDDIINGIAVDSVGSAWVTGFTNSANFPLSGAVQTICGGTGGAPCADAFVSKLNGTGSALLFSTFLGGGGDDQAFGVALDAVGSVYVAGATQSTNFPSTGGVFQGSPAGATDAFIAKIGDTGAAPFLSGLSPSSAQAGSPGFTLTVTGGGFVPGTVVRWNGADRSTTFQSAGLLAASIPASDVAVIGTAQVTVANPPPGGGVSNALTFTIGGNPAPVITSVQPVSARSGDGSFILTVDGNGFVSTTVVRWNGSDRATTFIAATRVQALIPGTDLTAAGVVQITVFNPPPLGGISNPVGFRVDNPVPLASSLSPATAPAGGPAFTLIVNGSGFVTGSVVRWNGSPRATTFVNPTQVRGAILASDIANIGAAQISVFNPAPGGGPSGVLTFTIVRAPMITAGGVVNAADFTARPLAAGTIAALFGANLATLTVSATSTPLPTFLAGVTVRMDGIAAPLFFVSQGQINFQVPWEMAGRTQASLTVDLAGTTSQPETVPLANFVPALFSANQRGAGQGAALVANAGVLAGPAGSYPGARPVTRGGFVEIYGVGFGPVTSQPASAAPAGSSPLSLTVATPTVSIGGVTASVFFSGLAPGFVGLYQINAQVSQNAATGDAVPVIVSIGDVASNTVTIAVQ